MDQPTRKRAVSPLIFKYFLLLFFISILMMGRLLWPLIPILILSYLLAGIFKPAYNFLHRKLSAPFASILTCLLILLIVFIPLVFFTATLSREALALYQLGKDANLGLRLRELTQDHTIIAQVQGFFNSLGINVEPETLSRYLSDIAKAVGLFLYDKASVWAANILLFIAQFFMMIVIIYFLLIDHERLINFLIRLSPLPDDQERQLIRKFDEIAWAVLIGNSLSGIIQGLLGGVAFAIFGFSSPVLWGGVMGVLAFLPIFGIGLVLVPAAFILLVKGKLVSFVIMLLFYMIVSFSIEYIFKPKMVGSQLKMHTLLVFLSIIGGLSVFGVMGIIYGPLIVTAFLTLADIYMATYDEYVKLEG